MDRYGNHVVQKFLEMGAQQSDHAKEEHARLFAEQTQCMLFHEHVRFVVT